MKQGKVREIGEIFTHDGMIWVNMERIDDKTRENGYLNCRRLKEASDLPTYWRSEEIDSDVLIIGRLPPYLVTSETKMKDCYKIPDCPGDPWVLEWAADEWRWVLPVGTRFRFNKFPDSWDNVLVFVNKLFKKTSMTVFVVVENKSFEGEGQGISLETSVNKNLWSYVNGVLPTDDIEILKPTHICGLHRDDSCPACREGRPRTGDLEPGFVVAFRSKSYVLLERKDQHWECRYLEKAGESNGHIYETDDLEVIGRIPLDELYTATEIPPESAPSVRAEPKKSGSIASAEHVCSWGEWNIGHEINGKWSASHNDGGKTVQGDTVAELIDNLLPEVGFSCPMFRWNDWEISLLPGDQWSVSRPPNDNMVYSSFHDAFEHVFIRRLAELQERGGLLYGYKISCDKDGCWWATSTKDDGTFCKRDLSELVLEVMNELGQQPVDKYYLSRLRRAEEFRVDKKRALRTIHKIEREQIDRLKKDLDSSRAGKENLECLLRAYKDKADAHLEKIADKNALIRRLTDENGMLKGQLGDAITEGVIKTQEIKNLNDAADLNRKQYVELRQICADMNVAVYLMTGDYYQSDKDYTPKLKRLVAFVKKMW